MDSYQFKTLLSHFPTEPAVVSPINAKQQTITITVTHDLFLMTEILNNETLFLNGLLRCSRLRPFRKDGDATSPEATKGTVVIAYLTNLS